MIEKVFLIENLAEWLRAKYILETHSIPFRGLKEEQDLSREDQQFPLELIFTQENYQTFEKYLTEDFPKNSYMRLDKKEPSFKLGRLLLIAYALLMTVLFIKYYHQNYTQNEQKNLRYSWNTDNTMLFIHHKHNKELLTTFVDANYDLNYEKVFAYSNNKRIIEQLDQDENGYYEYINYYVKDKKVLQYSDLDANGINELILNYGINGKLSGRSRDSNQDGLFDEVMIVLQNQDTLHLFDNNQDGFLELE